MQIRKGGERYPFCPGKASWDLDAQALFRLLIVSAEMKTLPASGGVMDQTVDIIETLAWFLPMYDWSNFPRKLI